MYIKDGKTKLTPDILRKTPGEQFTLIQADDEKSFYVVMKANRLNEYVSLN